MDVLGFTVNPVKVELDYSRLARQRPTAHVVCFVRSNIVKAVVSAVRGQLTLAKCGANNLRSGDKCGISPTLAYPAARFRRELYERLVLERTFMELVYGLGRPVYEVLYEDLQRDADGTVKGLLEHFGLPGAEALGQQRAAEAATASSSSSSSSSSSASTGNDGWVKRTSDDLRATVENFDELLGVLQREVRSPCLSRMLSTATAGVSFPPCPLPGAWVLDPPPLWVPEGKASSKQKKKKKIMDKKVQKVPAAGESGKAGSGGSSSKGSQGSKGKELVVKKKGSSGGGESRATEKQCAVPRSLEETGGKAYWCPCSCRAVSNMMNWRTGKTQKKRACPDYTVERHRFLCSYFNEKGVLAVGGAGTNSSVAALGVRPLRVLHIAPERTLGKALGCVTILN